MHMGQSGSHVPPAVRHGALKAHFFRLRPTLGCRLEDAA